MAEAALLGVAKSVIEQLGEPALQELLLVWNSKKDLQRLEQTIQTITDFLRDAERREPTNNLVRGWLSRLREVLYEADDLFDSVAFMALHKKAMSGSTLKDKVHRFSSKLKQPGFDLKVAHGVKDIRERLDGIKDDMSPFNFALIKPRVEAEESSVSVRLRNREETHSFVKVEDVIGRGNEREDIVSLLLGGGEEEGKSLSVVSVIGFGGMGKTTLAQLVCNDERVVSGFDVCLWVCINYLSDLKQVLVAILASAQKSKPDGQTLDQLQKMFREEIASKRFLLVLDDVWDDNASNWLKLKSLLSCGKNGNKVLVTTRSAKVAQCLDARKPYYHLNVLSEESACSLFVRMAFEDGEFSGSDSDELQPLVKEIVRKCGYVPLVLVTVGRMLRYKEKEKRSWMSFIEELPEVLSDAAGDGNGNIMQVLKFSYDDLPPPLKHCFAYCSLFPKDYVFPKDELVRLWIAQGFIVPHGKKSLEEVGDDYFFQMVHRCFFQEVEMYTKGFGCVEYRCKMHDLLHDLAIQVAGKECSYVGTGLESAGDKIAHCRHVSLHCNPNVLLERSSMSSPSKTLRTLLFFDEMKLEAKLLDSFCASFKVLRALQLSNLGLKKLPEAIGELIHLRYVNLSWNDGITYLPNSICKLHHLHSLILEDCRGLKKLPSNLGRLVSLRHLLLKGCYYLDAFPSGLAALTRLVTLDRLKVHPRNGGLRYMGHLDDLCGMLSIELPSKGWSNCIEDARESGMFRKHKLNGMSIEWEVDREVTHGLKEDEASVAKTVLEQLKPNENLQHLNIKGYEGHTLSNWFSSGLNHLKELVLSNCWLEYLEDVDCIRSVGSSLFPCLEILRMEDLHNLKGWWRDLGDKAPMPQLSSLPLVSEVDIDGCPRLVENMPLFGGEIKVLRLVMVSTKLLNMSLSSTSISKLQVLYLIGLRDLECLPEGSIKRLTALKSLEIAGCKELRWVSSRGLAYLTSLEKLMISFCGDVRLLDDETGCDESEMTTTEMMMPWASLQRLCKLEVPWQSHLLEGLQYLTSLEELTTVLYDEDDNVGALDEDMQGKLGLLERLHTLKVKFEGLQCNFPRWVQHLRCIKLLVLDAGSGSKELMNMSWGSLAKMNLRSLHMYGISKVSRCSVDDWVAEQQQQQLTSLVELFIDGPMDDQEGGCIGGIPWKLLPCLRTLELSVDGGWNVRSVPDGVQHLTFLQVLQIDAKRWYRADNDSILGIKAIPDWMINLTSLQRLSIRGCSPELAKRCEKQTGEDWHLISHIPDIDIHAPYLPSITM